VSKDFEPEAVTDDIYHVIKNDSRIRIPKKDLRHLRMVIGEVVDKYK